MKWVANAIRCHQKWKTGKKWTFSLPVSVSWVAATPDIYAYIDLCTYIYICIYIYMHILYIYIYIICIFLVWGSTVFGLRMDTFWIMGVNGGEAAEFGEVLRFVAIKSCRIYLKASDLPLVFLTQHVFLNGTQGR